jgi:hypothetical protein
MVLFAAKVVFVTKFVGVGFRGRTGFRCLGGCGREVETIIL